MLAEQALGAAVADFVREVERSLTEVAAATGADATHAHADALNEAFNLVTAVIDSDGRHADDELRALTETLGPLFDGSDLASVQPAQLRESTLVRDRASWLRRPSTLFEVLRAADESAGTTHADSYYRYGVTLAHVVAALGETVTSDELNAVSSFRTMLLHRLTPPTPPVSAPPDVDPPIDTDVLLRELDALVGLNTAKAAVHRLCDLLRINRIRAEHDLPTVDISLHQVFVGNPGTGKTTVARLLARIYRSLGVLERGQLVETDRAGMVAGFVGQTAPLVTKRFDEADGGVLFVDEAYTLARGNENDFGREAIDTIVKLMEDRRDRVVLIVAGYPAEMAQLIATNPGLESRFAATITFDDYSAAELTEIFDVIATKAGYRLDTAGRDALVEHLGAVPRNRGFGNARYARNIFEAAVTAQATRLSERRTNALTTDELMALTAQDIARAIAAGVDAVT